MCPDLPGFAAEDIDVRSAASEAGIKKGPAEKRARPYEKLLLYYKNGRRMSRKKKGRTMMAVRKAHTIAEYAIQKWMEQEGFSMECFRIVFEGCEALVTDGNGDKLKLVYDRNTRMVMSVDL